MPWTVPGCGSCCRRRVPGGAAHGDQRPLHRCGDRRGCLAGGGRAGFVVGAVLSPWGGGVLGVRAAGGGDDGVELDPTTAAIAVELYPLVAIHAESFADTRYPAGYFDGAIANVPFADVVLHDPLHNPGRHAMHNHFIV